jgi:hypothetical protein
MKRYGNIYEKIASVENLKEAHRMARADGVGMDKPMRWI